MDRMQCLYTSCPAWGQSLPVWGDGPSTAAVMLVGEKPEMEEDKAGRPFVGNAGRLLDHILSSVQLPRERAYITNIQKCMAGKLSAKEIRVCARHLINEIKMVSPKVIGLMGREATRLFLGDVDMENVHGIPFKYKDIVVVPIYHPAAGLHDPMNMLNIDAGFRCLMGVIRGTRKVGDIEDAYNGKEDYREVISPHELGNMLEIETVVAVDTEDGRDGPWCVTLSFEAGTAMMIKATDTGCLNVLAKHLACPHVITILHNAMHDLPVLSAMGVEPSRLLDTMVMAYLLQSEPQGLKPLAFRHMRMKMMDYGEMVGEASERKAKEYLEAVWKIEWPDPKPTIVWEKGKPRVKKPTNIGRKIRTILDKGDNLRDRWSKIEEESGRGMVEEVMGEMEKGYLSDIDPAKATWYACRDADATFRLFPIIYDRIREIGMGDVLDVDMHMMPMATDMMKIGMLIDKRHMAELGTYFQGRMDEIGHGISKVAEADINPGSPPQMASLLFDKLGLKRYKGRSTDDKKVLARLVGAHPVVQDIRDWRAYKKLKSSYSDVLPKKADGDGRVHTTIRITRVATGRLSSSDPNLMAQPVRTSEGRKIREGFVAAPGHKLMSGDYCLAPETRILTTDLEWVEAGKIGVGDLVWGVDEHRPSHGTCRKMRMAVVEKVTTVEDDSYMIITKSGKCITCSGKHRWLARRRNSSRSGAYEWRATEEIEGEKGWELWDAMDTWDQGGWEEGYFGGVMDGDGSLSFARGVVFTFAQSKGMLMDYVYQLTKDLGYNFHPPWDTKAGAYDGSTKTIQHIWISNRRDIGKILGTCRPPRLLRKGFMLFEGRRPPMKADSVVSTIPIGNTNLIGIQTSTGTMIAEGLVSHNSQIEMRVTAHDSQDPAMLHVFREGLDIHSQTASKMFGVPLDQVKEMEHRYPSKRIGFGILNDITPEGLQRELGMGSVYWSLSKCADAIVAWFDVYKGVKKYMSDSRTHALRHGYVKDMWGRVRYLPGLLTNDRRIREEALRQAGNAPIQMGAQGIIKRAMGELVPVYKSFIKQGYFFWPLIQIHDDLVWEIENEITDAAKVIVKKVMEECVKLSVPVTVDMKVGEKWGSIRGEK